MQLSAVLTLVAAATLVAADTNAARLARGLPPNPARRAPSRVEAARRHRPSNSPPGQCDTGSVQCCNSVGHSGEGGPLDDLLGLLNLDLDAGTAVGSSCSPILGSGGCSQQPVCCNDNSFNGLISVGCSPISIL